MDLPRPDEGTGRLRCKSQEGDRQLSKSDRPARGVGGTERLLLRTSSRLVGDCGFEDEGYHSALVRMFDQGLSHAKVLPATNRDKMLKRLDVIRGSLRGIGWGVSDAVNQIWHDRVD